MEPCHAGVLVTEGTSPHTPTMSRIMSRSARSATATASAFRACEHPGCEGEGEFRAPRSRETLDRFYWFCLDHVRAYNAAWNYYAGMSEAEIERELRNDTVWQRPTWPLGSRTGGAKVHGFGIFGLHDEEEAPPRRPRTPEEEALIVFEFDLAEPVTLVALKARYKELVKRHHPDTHGGDKKAEERLKIINQAYATLKARYFS
jgi:hypothetical protein